MCCRRSDDGGLSSGGRDRCYYSRRDRTGGGHRWTRLDRREKNTLLKAKSRIKTANQTLKLNFETLASRWICLCPDGHFFWVCYYKKKKSEFKKTKQIKNPNKQRNQTTQLPGTLVHAYNPSTWEAKRAVSLSWAGLPKLSQKNKKQRGGDERKNTYVRAGHK